MNELVKITATKLLAKMRSGEFSALEVFNAHADVIEATNRDINALVTLCLERAEEEARLADKKQATGKAMGALHGLPYAVKDTLPTKDVRTTFGSLLFEHYVPEEDALHVARAREAGAIVIGKSNTPEFASGTQTNNSVFGITKNPIDPGKTVTGSSGGGAAALAANMVPMADGSDLGGSLRSPASVCGIVGFRPTAGQVPKYANSLPFDSLHVFGPMARSVEDVALFMSVFAGRDTACPLSSVAEPVDFGQNLEISHKTTRLAISATPCGSQTHEEVQAVIRSHYATFQSIGCMVDEACPDIGENHAAQQVFVSLNAISELGGYMGDERFAKTSRLRRFLEKGRSITADEIESARKTQSHCWQNVSQFFRQYDFLVWPTMAGLPYSVELNEADIEEDWRPVELTPSLNLPAISLPAGYSHGGLPIGLQLIGPPNSDFRLLQLAYAFQQATNA